MIPRIPRTVHLVFLDFGNDMSVEWANNVTLWMNWAKQNVDWNLKLWGDKEKWPSDYKEQVIDPLNLFNMDTYKGYKSTYDAYVNKVERADFIRYMILHQFGGVYSDMDVHPATEDVKFDSLLQTYEQFDYVQTIWAESSNMRGVASNSFFASAKGANLLITILEEAVRRSGLSYNTRHIGIMHRTGPILVNDMRLQATRTNKLIPAQMLWPCDACGLCTFAGLQLLTDQHAGSWHDADSDVLSQLHCFTQRFGKVPVYSWVALTGGMFITIFILVVLLIIFITLYIRVKK